MRQENIKVVITGFGSVGRRILQELLKKEGIEVACVLDVNPEIVGKDAAELIGLGKSGIMIIDDEAEAYGKYRPDAALNCCTGINNAEVPFAQIKAALTYGVNVIVSSSDTSELWAYRPDLAKEIDELAKANGVSYTGIGSTHILERLSVFMTEGAQSLESIKILHSADVSAFDPESNKRGPGIGLTREEWAKRQAYEKEESEKFDGSEGKWEFASCKYISERIGWKIARTEHENVIEFDENDICWKQTIVCSAYDENDVLRYQSNWAYSLDPDKRYYQRITLDSVPSLDCTIELSPDRGLASTSGAIKNAIPHIINAEPGYISSFELPICHEIEGDYRRLIKEKN